MKIEKNEKRISCERGFALLRELLTIATPPLPLGMHFTLPVCCRRSHSLLPSAAALFLIGATIRCFALLHMYL
jgi:hypothetical protein